MREKATVTTEAKIREIYFEDRGRSHEPGTQAAK